MIMLDGNKYNESYKLQRSVDPAVFLCGEKIMRQPSSRVLGTSEKYEILRDGNVVATGNWVSQIGNSCDYLITESRRA